MALVTGTWTTATSESITRADCLKRLLREGFGDYGTATGGTTATIVDTGMLQSSAYPDDKYKGMWARIEYDAGGAAAAPEGEIRPVSASTASSGTVTVNPVFSVAPASGDRYQLWAFMHPQKVLDTLDQVMTQDCYLPEWTILTEVPDGDMEQNNTTDWVASSATLSKVSAEPALWGKRWLRVTTTGAGGYAQNAAALAVVPGTTYHLSVIARPNAATTTATLRAYDNTSGATIDLRTYTGSAPGRIHMTFEVPAGCHDIRLRMGATQSGVAVDFDELCFFSLDSTDLALPWWVTNKNQVKGIFETRWNALTTDVWDPQPVGHLERDRWDFRDSGFGRGQLRIVSRQGPPQDPVYIFGTRPETAWANENTETKHVDQDWLTARVMSLLFRQMQGPLSIGLQHADWVADRQRFWDEAWKRERKKQEERIQDVIQSQAPEVYVYSDRQYRDYWRDVVS